MCYIIYFTLIKFILLYFFLLYFTLLYLTLLYFTLLYFTLFYFILLYFTLLYFALLYFTFLYFILLYFTLLCFMSTLLYFTLHYFTFLYFTLLFFSKTLLLSASSGYIIGSLSFAQFLTSVIGIFGSLPSDWITSALLWGAVAAIILTSDQHLILFAVCSVGCILYSPSSFVVPDFIHSDTSCRFSETPHLCCCQHLPVFADEAHVFTLELCCIILLLIDNSRSFWEMLLVMKKNPPVCV